MSRFFYLHNPATTQIYTLSLHDALPISTVKRLAKRGVYDRDTVYAILDEALICHAGFVVDGAPVVIPTIHWRQGEDRKSTRLNSSHSQISYAVFCLKKKTTTYLPYKR